MHRRRAGVGRVAVVDWDVHHGNGTQAVFWEDPSVLAISLHQDGLYPARSGLLGETGAGAGAGHDAQRAAAGRLGHRARTSTPLDRVVVPALEAFAPELIVIACGFDAGALDPLGRMLLPAAAFGAMTERLLDAAGRLCDGRLVASHEGGYSAGHVPFCGLAVIEALSGLSAGIDDPFAYLADDPRPGARAAPARRGRRRRGARRRRAALSDAEARPRPERELDADAAARPPRRSSRWPSSPRTPASTP